MRFRVEPDALVGYARQVERAADDASEVRTYLNRYVDAPKAGGEVFRGGVTYRRGLGKLFYFSPGDQEYPVYHHPDIRRILRNGVRWAAPSGPRLDLTAEPHPTGWFE